MSLLNDARRTWVLHLQGCLQCRRAALGNGSRCDHGGRLRSTVDSLAAAHIARVRAARSRSD